MFFIFHLNKKFIIYHLLDELKKKNNVFVFLKVLLTLIIIIIVEYYKINNKYFNIKGYNLVKYRYEE